MSNGGDEVGSRENVSEYPTRPVEVSISCATVWCYHRIFPAVIQWCYL